MIGLIGGKSLFKIFLQMKLPFLRNLEILRIEIESFSQT